MLKRLKKGLLIIEIIPKLGINNVAYIIWYKISLLVGFRKGLFPKGRPITGTFFHRTANEIHSFNELWKKRLLLNAEELIDGKFTYFSQHKYKYDGLPNWFYNPFINKEHTNKNKHWTTINDFAQGDVKVIWELSRFDWLTILARAFRVTSKEKYLDKINELLLDWSFQNPLNIGPNWKCGQEASIRLMKLITTSNLLNSTQSPSKSLIRLIEDHLHRIYPNINYAIAQNNNHGTSEAAALYIGSVFLNKLGIKDHKYIKWGIKGRKILQDRIIRLIDKDGTFAQKSMTYHRVMVDTMSFVLQNMKLLDEKAFDKEILAKLTSLGKWQYKLTFGNEGDAPNLGSNDGAMLNNLHSCDYRDFRPSTQSFFALLLNKRVYEDLKSNEAMFWTSGSESLNYPLLKIEMPSSEMLDNDVVILRKKGAFVMIKTPTPNFRPGNDAFHLDFWLDGKNILRDSGTYSYNEGELTDYFKGVMAHNTVQFGNHDQMPKISRFLNGKWISTRNQELKEEENELSWKGSYKDYKGNKHSRVVRLSDDELLIIDNIKTSEEAVVRFHLNEYPNQNIDCFWPENHEILSSIESRYYYQKKKTPMVICKFMGNEVINKFKFRSLG